MLPEHLKTAFFATVPFLQIEAVEGGVRIRNETLGTSLQAPRAILEVLEYFRVPRALGEAFSDPALQAIDVPPEILPDLLLNALVVNVEILATPAASPIGRSVTMTQYCAHAEEADLVVLGATVDSAASGRGGTREGPHEIRANCRLPLWPTAASERRKLFELAGQEDDTVVLDLDFRRQYHSPAPRVLDLGNLDIVPGESIHSYGARIRMVASLIAQRRSRVGTLGGDHSVTAFVLDALAERVPAFGIIHFDAHPDLVAPMAPNLDYLTHARPFSRILKSDSLKVLFQLGLRTLEPLSRAQLSKDPRIRYLSARELQHLSPEAAFEHLPTGLPYYLTFDIDCLDPSIAAETGTPVAGGLSYYQAVELVDWAASHYDLLGWDVVEVGQRESGPNRAAIAGAGIVRTLILSQMKHEPISHHWATS
jgi:arginase family enzyme